MRYTGFEIKNFKGIKEAKISFGQTGQSRIFCLVGLNESGKTTVLEALHSFAPDSDVDVVVGNVSDTDEKRQLAVPRSKIADFTGRVSIKANIATESGDADRLADFLKSEYSIQLDRTSVPNEFWYERYSEYKNGDLTGNFYNENSGLKIKTGRQRSYRDPDKVEEEYISEALRTLMPSIAYFPSFVFEFPDRIYLSRFVSGPKNKFYRRLFQDILDFGGRGHKIQDHIVNRVRKEEYQVSFVGFLPIFFKSNEKQQIDQVIDHAARTVTSVVYTKWNEIFGEETDNKEIVIDWHPDSGKTWSRETKSMIDSTKHDIYVEFQVKGGPDRFSIGTRSLGFRWFFSFLLFTQFRATRNADRSVMFLLDEPASNLHASAQQKLIESFPEIVRDKHILVYSTHSHYMIEPKWLEQAYIVQNEPTLSGTNMMASATLNDSSVDVKVTPYRQFISKSSNAISFFQPIADRLNVVPSKFDIDKPGIILEGKSDYYILEYFKSVNGLTSPRLYPALGAGTLSALISLLRGWGQNISIVLDSDTAGQKERDRYIRDFSLNENEIKLLEEFIPNAKKIEDIFSLKDREELAKLVGKSKLSKKDILLIFQENLTKSEKLPIERATQLKVKAALEKLQELQETDTID